MMEGRWKEGGMKMERRWEEGSIGHFAGLGMPSSLDIQWLRCN